MQCLPDSLAGKRYYEPTMQGQEAQISKRLADIIQQKKVLREANDKKR